MDGIYERPVTGVDVIAQASSAGLEPRVAVRLAGRVDADAEFRGLDDLARAAGPAELGMTPGRWAAVFGPLFGEFE
jgi:hypothetical protein